MEELEPEGALARTYYGIVLESTPALATAGQQWPNPVTHVDGSLDIPGAQGAGHFCHQPHQEMDAPSDLLPPVTNIRMEESGISE